MTALTAPRTTVIPVMYGPIGAAAVVRANHATPWERVVLSAAAAMQRGVARRVVSRARREAALDAHRDTAAEAWRYLGARGR